MSSESSYQTPSDPPSAIIKAINRLFRPLVRFLIAYGVTYPSVINLLKRIYVEEAEQSFQVERKRQTDSRISLITGVHRKDVKRLRGRDSETAPAPLPVSIGAQMVAIWIGDQTYLDTSDKPRPLPRLKPKDGSPSFEGLVESVSKDVRPRTVLDEWTRQDIVTVDEDGIVHLNTDAFVPKKDLNQLAYYFGRNVQDHIAASVQNIQGHGARFPERSVYYDKLTPESVEALHEFSREAGMEALVKINKVSLERAEADENKPDATYRMNFGLYFYSVDEEKEKHTFEDDEDFS